VGLIEKLDIKAQLAANTHPDHNTIAIFRRRFLPQ